MNVPVEGVAANGRIYVFTSAGFKDGVHCCSALAHTPGLAPEFDSLVFDKYVETSKFVNICAFVENDTVWIFGSDVYRPSSVSRENTGGRVADRDAWEYFVHLQDGSPVF